MQIFKILFLYIAFTGLVLAQPDSLVVQYDDSEINIEQIRESDIESYTSDSDFNYTEVSNEDNFFTKLKRWLQNILTRFFEYIFGVGTARGFLYFVFNIFPYMLLAFLVFMLIRFFLKVNSRNIFMPTENKNTIAFTDEEDIIKNEDIDTLIKDAIKRKNYRLAIRYYYLLTLKYLTNNNLINWQQQKTNADYILELEKEAIQSHFKEITTIYDYVWYGEFDIDELKFEDLKLTFESLNAKIK